MVVIKAVSLRQAALSSCRVPTIAQEQDPLTQELGEDLATARATDPQGVPTLKVAVDRCLTAPGHLHPASVTKNPGINLVTPM